MTNTTWSTTLKTNVTLSNANLTATATGVGGVRANDTQTSGKYYVEYTTGATFSNSNSGVGICNGAVNLATVGAVPTAAALVYKSGAIWINNANTSLNIGAFTTNALICVAVDLAAQLIWFRLGSGNWNGSGTADPATATGGRSIASIAPTYQKNFYPCFGVNGANDGVTVNFGDSIFAGVFPAGFTSGWPSGTSAAITMTLVTTQAGANVWYTTSSPPLRVSTAGAEAWAIGNPSVYITEAGANVWYTTSSPPLRVSTAGAEVWGYSPPMIFPVAGIGSAQVLGTPTIIQPYPSTLLPNGISSYLSMGTPRLVDPTLLIIIPKSALIPNDYYYTDIIGGGFGTLMITTGGGNAANIGDPTGRNDDGFRGPIVLGFTIRFFGNDYTSFYLNNNGNISFNEGISNYTPVGPQGQPEPIISPYFADLDSRGPLSGLVYYRQDIPNQLIVTWDQVGYFDVKDDLFVSFQLVLRGPDYVVPPGEGFIGFFWKDIQWETGDASGGHNGFGGTPAAVGFGDGLDRGKILEGSIEDGISATVNHKRLWFDVNLIPLPDVPPPPTRPVVFVN